MNDKWTWWKHGVIYQIYPRSFYDSNGDGIGDIPGIIEKLDYLSDLGVDAVWLSPVNRSPMHDFGYDVSDYRGIDPVFGTNRDFKTLISEAHRRGIRIVMDMVVNHTSYLHAWFQESRLSRDSDRRDWYIWRDGSNGKPPTNWMSAFGGSAWEWDETTGQYYLHSCLWQQPDVNWRNPCLKSAMFDEFRYWLDRGVDGFRLDVVNWLVKDDLFRDNPRTLLPHQFQKHRYDRNRPEVHDILRELRRITDEYGERMLVGEVFSMPPGDPRLSAAFLGDGADELHLAFDFSLIYSRWDARRIWKRIERWLRHVPEPGWPCHVLSNHDQPRSVTRFGGDGNALRRARVAATLLLTLRGTPFIYYGEEIGMSNARVPRRRIRDPLGKRYWPLFPGRDPARTPMQWSSDENAGFTRGNVWLPVHPGYRDVNVEIDLADRYSMLNHYKSLIALRKRKKALSHGELVPLLRGERHCIAYMRRHETERVCVVMNFSDRAVRIDLGERAQWKVISSTHRFINEHFTSLRLKVAPFEASILECIGCLD
jgi:alpha-glucosidase